MPERKSCSSHCCERHGCKYDYEDCLVMNKQVEQEGPCEDCPTFPDISESLHYWRAEFDFWAKLNKRKSDQLLADHRQILKEKKKDAR